MFKRILIANRGEIAVRVARACREMGISPIAVYSDVDRSSLHVRRCDQAVHIGPSPSAESYLSIEKIIGAARQSHADAIHPGYGFLSENAEFAEAVEQAGLVLIGPPSKAMRLMGSKTSARTAAAQAGAPVVPGTTAPLGSIVEAKQTAETIGYPIMLKASAGGGGRGLRLVNSADEIEPAFQIAQSEAASSFKDSSVYIEKYIARPRHIEVQIIGDQHGNLVHLAERECTLQRRHQKVLEECPSPVVDPDLRDRMGRAALLIASAAGYYNAGTIEFLVDQQGEFYFLEMNTRLQVEHPVTELVVGRDLVHEQIKVAAGLPLSFSESDVVLRGAAIECRLYAEDPNNGFLPSPGRITALKLPSGPGVRDDGGVYAGWEVPMYYDSLLAKLSVWGETRETAINRLSRALDEYVIDGIKTTLPFFRALTRNEAFRRADFDTGFIDRFLNDGLLPKSGDVDCLRDLAAVAAAIFARTEQNSVTASEKKEDQKQSNWKSQARHDALR
ncbi:MAG TPA: acetyl-CoA carboxylase biotin carboxylase subunit [Blastocatellia bacterium]|nr:acetyl-CoA carboxylase biotin carboxylase subunit [Blastocatellia bacterium]